MEQILFYEGPWYFFSNFSSFAIYWRDEDWPTTEHAYQASKFMDEAIRVKIRTARSAHDTKKIAKEYRDQIRPDWQEINIGIMEELLRAKLDQHPHIQRKLLETGDGTIIENSPKDDFWGRGVDRKGRNELGKLWMKLRKELQAKQVA